MCAPVKECKMGTTGYLGPEGSYSQTAACAIGGALVAYPSFHALVGALVSGRADGVVLPLENSLNGGVMQNLDLLQSAEGIIAVREIILRIDHRLVTLKGAPLSGIRKIYSHPQALGQCAKFIRSRFPHAELIHTSSTSACLGLINSPSDAGIIGMQPVDDRFELSSESIADEPANYTQFLYVVRGGPDPSRHTNKIFLSFTCEHRPGALLGALSVFAGAGVNLTRIESRPIKDRPGEYAFFVETEADYALPEIRQLLRSLADMCLSFKILGCY